MVHQRCEMLRTLKQIFKNDVPGYGSVAFISSTLHSILSTCKFAFKWKKCWGGGYARKKGRARAPTCTPISYASELCCVRCRWIVPFILTISLSFCTALELAEEAGQTLQAVSTRRLRYFLLKSAYIYILYFYYFHLMSFLDSLCVGRKTARRLPLVTLKFKVYFVS